MTEVIWLMFMGTVESLKICALMGLFCPKHIKCQIKKYKRAMWMESWRSDVELEEKLTLGSKNDMKNSVSYNASSGKSENLNFDVLLLLKVYYVSAKKAHTDGQSDAKFEE